MSNPNLVGIKQIKMMIKTSIPDKDEYIEFTSSLLDVKSKGKPFSKYPFFSDTFLYPKIKLQNFSYERVVEFFFNKDMFLKIIRNKTRKVKDSNSKPIDIKLHNFELTLRLLFPTTFPLVNNIENSIEYILPSEADSIFTLKGANTFNVLPTRFDKKFSYLKIGPETYTITKTIWKNDVMNHPVYNEILQTYKQFDVWKSDPSLNIFQGTNAEDFAMDTILLYVFDSVQKSNEDYLLKPMYTNGADAPYNRSGRLDENTLSIKEFDEAIDGIMQKKDPSGNLFFVKYNDNELRNKMRENLKVLDKKEKLVIINLLGKLINTKSMHNISLDFSNLIDYLKTKITYFDSIRKINIVIKDLNIKFLTDPKYKNEETQIQNFYVEFYNLALVIANLKGRKIDNKIWSDIIFKMTSGTLKENEFNDILWDPIQDCYPSDYMDDDEDDDTNEDDDYKKEKKEKKREKKKCNIEVIKVGLDIIPLKEDTSNNTNEKETKGKRKQTIQTIEIYLQMDVIEGKIDESNMDKIKCVYDDEFLGSMFRDLMNTGNQINSFPSQQVFFSAKKILEEGLTDNNKTDNNKTRKGGSSASSSTTKKRKSKHKKNNR